MQMQWDVCRSCNLVKVQPGKIDSDGKVVNTETLICGIDGTKLTATVCPKGLAK